MVKAKVKYDIKVHSAAVRSSIPYRSYRALAVIGAVEFILLSFIIVITAWSKHKITVDMILLLSVFLGIFVGSAIKLLLMNPVRSFRKHSAYYPDLRYEVTLGGDNIEFVSEAENLRKTAVYSNTRIVSARETLGYFKINIAEVGSIMFSDTDITEGTAEELRNFLTATLGKRYTTKEGWI
jgi:hypothetical protein